MSTKKTTNAKATKSVKAKATKTAKAAKAKPAATKKAVATNGDAKKLSAINAAAKVLGETNEPMNCQELIEAMATKGLWSSPGGKTPHATLYSAILREINTKSADSRFKKTERGKFAVNA